MAGRSLALMLLAAALLAAAPSAQANEAMFPGAGCIPCSSCSSAWCWRVCRPSCGYVPFTPNNVIVSGDSCRASGQSYGPTAGASACDAARSRCSGLMGSAAPSYGAAAIGGVTLSQCSSIALGACQQGANLNSCGGAAQIGYGSCDAFTFRQYFAQAAESTCRGYAISVTDVNPGTNSWVVPPYVPPYAPAVPVYVPGSIGGGAIIGSAAPVVVGSAAPTADGSSDGDSSDGASDDGARRRLMGAARRMLRGL